MTTKFKYIAKANKESFIDGDWIDFYKKVMDKNVFPLIADGIFRAIQNLLSPLKEVSLYQGVKFYGHSKN